MKTKYPRDYAMYAAVFGLFGFSWFGWAQASPPEDWRIALGTMSAISFLIACAGGFLAAKRWKDASALNKPGAYRTFGVIVAIECTLSLIGALSLLALHLPDYVAPYISFIVAIHFIPLGPLFQNRALYLLAALVAVTSVTAVCTASYVGLTATTIATTGSGIWLLLFAFTSLVVFFRSHSKTTD